MRKNNSCQNNKVTESRRDQELVTIKDDLQEGWIIHKKLLGIKQ